MELEDRWELVPKGVIINVHIPGASLYRPKIDHTMSHIILKF